MTRILKCCDGPDIQVDEDHAKPLHYIYDAKTNKDVGSIQAFLGRKNICIYVVDRREKTGEVRRAYLFERAGFSAEQAMLAIPRGRDTLKAVLRAMGYESPAITAGIDTFQVERHG